MEDSRLLCSCVLFVLLLWQYQTGKLLVGLIGWMWGICDNCVISMLKQSMLEQILHSFIVKYSFTRVTIGYQVHTLHSCDRRARLYWVSTLRGGCKSCECFHIRNSRAAPKRTAQCRRENMYFWPPPVTNSIHYFWCCKTHHSMLQSGSGRGETIFSSAISNRIAEFHNWSKLESVKLTICLQYQCWSH